MRSFEKGCYRIWTIFLCMGLALAGCATMETAPKAQLQANPQKVLLSADLLKSPPEFRGSGFKPGEAVTVDLLIPKGVKIKTVPEGEPSVGIAFGKANERGEFEAKMAPTAIFNWFLQVEWTPDGKPDMKKATPLPSGTYHLKAVGVESDAVGTTTIQIDHPPKQ